MDRNYPHRPERRRQRVALRKESVDRNYAANAVDQILPVALRKESVDRNLIRFGSFGRAFWSLSARRAWIEIKLDKRYFLVL